MSNFKIIKPGDYFITLNAGVEMVPEATCDHGHAAVFLVLFGRHRSQDKTAEQHVHALMPRCVLAQAIGLLHAHIFQTEGEAALDKFIEDIADHAAIGNEALEQLHEQGRDCCEAGFRTHGSEHTCGRNETGQ